MLKFNYKKGINMSLQVRYKFAEDTYQPIEDASTNCSPRWRFPVPRVNSEFSCKDFELLRHWEFRAKTHFKMGINSLIGTLSVAGLAFLFQPTVVTAVLVGGIALSILCICRGLDAKKTANKFRDNFLAKTPQEFLQELKERAEDISCSLSGRGLRGASSDIEVLAFIDYLKYILEEPGVKNLLGDDTHSGLVNIADTQRFVINKIAQEPFIFASGKNAGFPPTVTLGLGPVVKDFAIEKIKQISSVSE